MPQVKKVRLEKEKAPQLVTMCSKCCCSDLSLVNAYQPSTELDWRQVSLESNPLLLQYKQKEVAAEFNRFAFRDLSVLIVATMYFAGSVFYPGTTFPIGEWTWSNWGAAVIFLFTIPIEYYIHRYRHGAAMSTGHARTRLILQYINALVCTFCTTITIFLAYYTRCPDIQEMTVQLKLRSPESFSQFRQHVYCKSILNPFTLSTLTFSMLCFSSLPVMAVVSIFLFEWAQEILARVLVPHDPPETGTQMATKALASVVFSLITFWLMFLRRKTSMVSFEQAIRLAQETKLATEREEEVDLLLCAMVPTPALVRLLNDEHVFDYAPDATVLFSDIVQFTAWSSCRSAGTVVMMLNTLCHQLDLLAGEMNVEKIKTIGDAYWAVSGLPNPDEKHAENICNFGIKMLDAIFQANAKHPEWDVLEVRVGIHSGPVFGGVLGTQRISYEVFGETSRIAEEVEKHGRPSRVTVSADTLVTYLGFEIAKEPDCKLDVTFQGEQRSEGAAQTGPLPTKRKKKPPTVRSEDKGGSPPQPVILDLFYLPRHVTDIAAVKNSNFFAVEADGGSDAPSGETHRRVSCVSSRYSSRTSSQRSAGDGGTGGDGAAGGHKALLNTKALRQKFVEAKTRQLRQELLSDKEDPNFEAQGDSLLLGDDFTSPGGKTTTASAGSPHYSDPGAPQGEERKENRREDEPFDALAALEARYSKRKYSRFLYTFADPSVEAEYCTFAEKRQYDLRVASRLGTVVVGGTIIIGCTIEHHSGGGMEQSSPMLIPLLLLVLGIFVAAGDLSLAFWYSSTHHRTLPTRAIVVLHHLSALLLFLGAGLMLPGTSSFTNDITYLHGVMTMLVAVGNVGLAPVVWLIAINLVLFVPLVIVLIWRVVVFTSDVTFLIQSNLVICILLLVLEKQYRRQFMEQHVAQYYQGKQQENNEQQEALLASIVPQHIILPLMLWLYGKDNSSSSTGAQPTTTIQSSAGGKAMTTAFNPTYQIVREYSSVCVCFLKLSPVVQLQKHCNNWCDEEDDTQPEAEADSDGDDEAEMEPEGASSFDWLGTAHIGVDDILRRYSAIEKIKTIGEVVMLAGPFASEHTASTRDSNLAAGAAADQMLAAVHEIRSVAHVEAGLHVGEIVGAVLGTSRLCFDIFGDTVNISSRALSTGGEGEVSLTEQFFSVLQDHYEDCSHQHGVNLQNSGRAAQEGTTGCQCHAHSTFRFSETKERRAKGKSEPLLIRTVTEVLQSSASPHPLRSLRGTMVEEM